MRVDFGDDEDDCGCDGEKYESKWWSINDYVYLTVDIISY